MAIIDKEGNILSKYGTLCSECLAERKAHGGFSHAEIKRFRQVDSDMDILCTHIFSVLYDLSKKDNGLLDFSLQITKGRNTGISLPYDDKGKVVLY
jgi:hypothetical protein